MSIAFNEGSQVLDSDAYDLKDHNTASKFNVDEEDEDDYYDNVQLGSGRSYGQRDGSGPKTQEANQLSPTVKQFMAEKEGQIR